MHYSKSITQHTEKDVTFFILASCCWPEAVSSLILPYNVSFFMLASSLIETLPLLLTTDGSPASCGTGTSSSVVIGLVFLVLTLREASVVLLLPRSVTLACLRFSPRTFCSSAPRLPVGKASTARLLLTWWMLRRDELLLLLLALLTFFSLSFERERESDLRWEEEEGEERGDRFDLEDTREELGREERWSLDLLP